MVSMHSSAFMVVIIDRMSSSGNAKQDLFMEDGGAVIEDRSRR